MISPIVICALAYLLVGFFVCGAIIGRDGDIEESILAPTVLFWPLAVAAILGFKVGQRFHKED